MADLQHMPWSQSVVTLTPVDEGLPGQNLGEDDDDETVTLAGDRAIPQTGAVPDPANPSTFVLLLEHDDPSDTRIYTTDGRTMYTVTTRGQGASEMSRVLVTSLNDRLGQSIGSYIRPSGRGAEMVTLNGQEPVKRASWLASGRTFSNKYAIS
ncbi:hypothetical protein SISSUDRAFT_467110 [Sistotremastrum suecicum HHB10207 ss-3]|uniref:Uncharacterized protein n=1 Tax=Sistotremastrum suecicum HHB10207 ss-3 TaxID=1314776 RepID=A0A166FFF9_9AGAM|nr:hypothetical protein SISSUDRAFT_467110 [Sistotremastrum suecicum HHB10207 ss-3]